MRGELTLGNVILIVIVSAIWPWAVSLLIDAFMASVPQPPPGLTSQAYGGATSIATFIKSNAELLSVASVLFAAILVRWRGL